MKKRSLETPTPPKRQTIRLSLGAGGLAETTADVYDSTLAIHRTEDGFFQVTHVKSGMALGPAFVSAARAEARVRRLLATDHVDWRFSGAGDIELETADVIRREWRRAAMNQELISSEL
jgi:hypothetical protein